MSGTLIIDHSWQQAAIFFVMAGGLAITTIMARGFEFRSPRFLGAMAGCAVIAWIGGTLTFSARIDARGVALHAPAQTLQRSAFIAWEDMAGAEIVPCGADALGLRLVSRNGQQIVIALDQLTQRERSTVLTRVAVHPSVQMTPDARTFYALADRTTPSPGTILRRL